MKRLLAILILGLLALGSVGLSATTAGAGAASCAPSASAALADVEALIAPVSQKEGPEAKNRSRPAEGPQYACNSRCARACAQRFGHCPTRQCREAYRACVRGCGC